MISVCAPSKSLKRIDVLFKYKVICGEVCFSGLALLESPALVIGSVPTVEPAVVPIVALGRSTRG
jgi:hypothetical protein